MRQRTREGGGGRSAGSGVRVRAIVKGAWVVRGMCIGGGVCVYSVGRDRDSCVWCGVCAHRSNLSTAASTFPPVAMRACRFASASVKPMAFS